MPKTYTYYSHRACSYILKSHSSDIKWSKKLREFAERSHGCWCSSWLLKDDKWQVWRNGGWTKPKPGEIRKKVLDYPLVF